MKSDLVDIDVIVVHKTDKAVLVRLDEESVERVWLPLSAIEIEYKGPRTATITLPESLATEKGLT